MSKDAFDKIDKYWGYRPILWFAVACMISFFIWASITNIHEQVRGSGRVIPTGDMRVIQHLEGGIIKEIVKEEGERVKANDVILYIDNLTAQTEQEELQIAILAKQIKLLRLRAELEQKDELKYSNEIIKRYPQIIESEKQVFNSRKSEQSEVKKGLEKRMKQKVLRLDDLTTTKENLRQELEVAKEKLAIKEKLRKTGAISRSQYLETLSEVKNFETRIDKTEKEIPIVKSELSEITNLMEETKQKWNSEVGEQISEVQIDIKKLQERLRAITDRVSRSAVRSPVDGVINQIYINTIGGVVQPGSRLADILPAEDTLIIEGRITTNERGKVWPNLPVIAKITAYDFTLYGGLDGKLVYISPNSFIDNQNNEYYEIRVEIDASQMGDDLPVYPGMTAELNILAGKISVMHSILKPFLAIKQNALREK
jgi:HlyD family type I secretion membrane fusion protein